MVSEMFDKAIQFLKDHKEIALATSEGNLPKLRIFQIMKQEGHVLYFATSAQKAVYRELRQNPNVEILAYADSISVRCSGMVNFNVEDDFSISTSLQARFAIQRENNYKKTGSSKAAFQTGCGTALFVPELSTE